MADPVLPANVAARIAALETQVANLARAQNPVRPSILQLNDVAGVPTTGGLSLVYDQTQGKWTARRPERTITARSSSTLGLTTSYADVPGTSVAITTATDNVEFVMVIAVDFEVTAAGAVVCEGIGVLDGTVIESGQAANLAEQATRATVGQTYRGVIATAGAHTLKLQAKKTGASGTANANSGHTGFVALLLD